MSPLHDQTYLIGLVRELCRLPKETEWVELKANNDDPQSIGEYLSALANSATLLGKATAHLVWGIDDITRAVVGTTFAPWAEKKGNEELESWLLRLLSPRIEFSFHEVLIDEKRVVLLEIDRASRNPVAFSGVEYVRIGSYKKKLKDYPDKERQLWRIFDHVRYEDEIADEHVQADGVLLKLDYPAYFDLLSRPLPEGREAILDALLKDKLVTPCPAGGFNITNLGAILLAKRLDDFPRQKRKAMRVIQYKGKDRTETVREQVGAKGYANGFEGLITFINSMLPSNELMGKALRKTVPMFPELAVRELVANALIHQDFSMIGVGPMVEIFADRIEITNPGEPLVDPQRFVDTPPQSRNESLASLMRRMGICEERGSGVDKVIFQAELYQLPGPLFENPTGFTRSTLFAHRSLNSMDKQDRIRACYLHASLKFVNREFLTNASLRERFGVEEHNRSIVSRLIKEATDAGQIVCHDPAIGPKLRKYVPWWAT